MNEEALALRKIKKGKKPVFIQQEAHKIKGVPQKWRKPRGRHAKMRLHLRGYKRWPKTGWGSPQSVKGLHHTGLEIIMVHTLGALEQIDNAKQGIIIGGGVGSKKKLDLIAAAQSKNITILNIKDVAAKKKQIQDRFALRKEKKKVEAKKEEKKKPAKKEKAAAKEAKAEEKTEEDKKEQEKKEKDKLLTQRQ